MKLNDDEVKKEEEEKSIAAYKEAAMYDDFIFGDYDYEKFWLKQESNDIF